MANDKIVITPVSIPKGKRVRILKISQTQSSKIQIGASYIGRTIREVKKGDDLYLDNNFTTGTITSMFTTEDGRKIVSTQTSVYLVEFV